MKTNLIACFFLAVGVAAAPALSAAPAHEHSHEHAHGEHGPHGGDLIELGKGVYHAELCHDDTANEVTIYLLDAKAKQTVAAPLKEITLNFVVKRKPVQYKLTASPIKSDPKGQSSRFSTKDAALYRLIAESPEFHGRMSVAISGKQYVGTIHHHAHEHQHDHEQANKQKSRF
jgi:hypothetical protein